MNVIYFNPFHISNKSYEKGKDDMACILLFEWIGNFIKGVVPSLISADYYASEYGKGRYNNNWRNNYYNKFNLINLNPYNLSRYNKLDFSHEWDKILYTTESRNKYLEYLSGKSEPDARHQIQKKRRLNPTTHSNYMMVGGKLNKFNKKVLKNL